jgi:hypothetical protein
MMSDNAPTTDNTAADAARADADAAAAADAATAAATDAARADADAAAVSAAAVAAAQANAAIIAAAAAAAGPVPADKAAASVAAAATLDGATTNDAGDVTTVELDDANLTVTRVTLAAGGTRFDFLDKNSGRTSPEHPDALPPAVPANDPLASEAPAPNDPLAPGPVLA